MWGGPGSRCNLIWALWVCIKELDHPPDDVKDIPLTQNKYLKLIGKHNMDTITEVFLTYLSQANRLRAGM